MRGLGLVVGIWLILAGILWAGPIPYDYSYPHVFKVTAYGQKGVVGDSPQYFYDPATVITDYMPNNAYGEPPATIIDSYSNDFYETNWYLGSAPMTFPFRETVNEVGLGVYFYLPPEGIDYVRVFGGAYQGGYFRVTDPGLALHIRLEGQLWPLREVCSEGACNNEAFLDVGFRLFEAGSGDVPSFQTLVQQFSRQITYENISEFYLIGSNNEIPLHWVIPLQPGVWYHLDLDETYVRLTLTSYKGIGEGIAGDVKMNFSVAPVPLPGAMWFLFSGCAGLWGWRRYHRKRAL